MNSPLAIRLAVWHYAHLPEPAAHDAGKTGLVVNVPPFVNSGDVVRISTDTGEYLSRA